MITSLDAALKKLEAKDEQIDALTRANLQLVAQVTTMSGTLDTVSAQLAMANEQIAELLAVLGRRASPSRTSSAPVAAPAHLDEEAKRAFDERPQPPGLDAPKKTPKKQRSKAGRNALPDHLQRDEAVLIGLACPACASEKLIKVRKHVEEKLHVVEAHFRVRRTERWTCHCDTCGKRGITPRAPAAPFARSKATCEWLAWFVWTRHALLVPMDRLRRDMSRKGLDLAMSYLVSQVERAADILAPIDGEHWKQLLAGDWMAMDATGLKVQVKALKGTTHNGYLEAFRNDEIAVFQYEATKEAGPLEQKLKGFSGVLVADAEHRHNGLFADGTIVEAGCNAHGRRKLRDAEVVQPKLAKEAGAFVSKVYEAERKGLATGLTGEALKSWRQAECGPHFDALATWIAAVKPTLLPSDALRKVLQYYENHWAALTRFLDHPEIPIDNSGTERLYQPIAKLRHNVLFAGSTEGAHRLAVILGIVATCRAHGIDGQAYLAWVFTRLGTHRDLYDLSAAELTPLAYAAALARDGPSDETPATTG